MKRCITEKSNAFRDDEGDSDGGKRQKVMTMETDSPSDDRCNYQLRRKLKSTLDKKVASKYQVFVMMPYIVFMHYHIDS